MTKRETTQTLFVRVCRDSGFQLDAVRAAQLTASMVGCHPLEVWLAMPSLTVMNEIAAGTHPAAGRAALHPTQQPPHAGETP
jgi:hypothetical protein